MGLRHVRTGPELNADTEHLSRRALAVRDRNPDAARALLRCAGDLAVLVPEAERGDITRLLADAHEGD